tara:strand:- start:486 stop:2504 length:2019 start_codon:yes stop_codon:yes gene_type:complete
VASNQVNILISAETKEAIDKFQKVSKAVAGVSLAVTGVGLALVKIGDELKTATNNIAIGTGASGAELEALKEEFRDVARAVPQDFDTVSKAVANVKTELGLTGDALEGATKRFLDLSRITGSEVTPLIKQVSDTMDLFGMSADQSSDAIDAFTVASQKTGVPISQLTGRVVEFAPVLRNLGMGMNETIAFLGQLEGAGISASRVMPGLNASMRRLANSGVTDMKEALESEMVAIRDATGDTEALNLATDLFGAEGAQRMSVAIRDGTVDIATLSKALDDSGGSFDTINENSLTAGDRFKIMGDKIKLSVEPLAGTLSAFGAVALIIPAVISGLTGLVSILSVKNIQTALATIKTVALTVATVAQTAVTWLAVTATTALNLALSPIGLIILGIAGAVAGAILVWKNWDKIVAVLTATWEKFDSFLSDKFPATWQFLKDYISTIVNFWKDVFKGFIALFKGDWDGAIEHFKSAFGRVKEFWESVISGMWNKIDNFMTDKFGGVWDKAKHVVGEAVSFISDTFSGLVETLRGVWDLIVGIFTGDTDLIKQGFKGIVNGIITMVNAMIDLVNSFKFEVPDWVVGIGGKSWGLNIPNIPALAEGGIVNKPTLAMIGESGSEAVVPLSRGGGALGGVTVNVMMPEGGTVILDDEATAQRFGDFITTQVREVLRTQGAF